MAGTSLLALIDDIATLLDDVAVLSKVALQKTAGVLGDDLALNAEQVMGVKADRELPVIYEVAKGSFKNKCILVPGALLISALLPIMITILLMCGGAFLCYEGAEKVIHKFFKKKNIEEHKALLEAVKSKETLMAYEKNKIKGAIRTDFILSAEIIVITLGSVADASFLNQVLVLVGIAIAITFGIYGLVAAIVKLDDLGLYLLKTPEGASMITMKKALGGWILAMAPKLMKGLSFIGTLAMFIVGGGIILHGIPQSHELFIHVTEIVDVWPYLGPAMALIAPTLTVTVAGFIFGLILVTVITPILKLLGREH